MVKFIEATPVVQNKQDFLIGVFSIKNILGFTKFTKRLIVSYDENEAPIYNKQIQRFIEDSRVEKIADFLIRNKNATFPTNIVLHVPKEVITEYIVEKNGRVKIFIDEKVFTEIKKNDGDVFINIIDGQHRIRGIEVAIERLKRDIETLHKTLRTGENKGLRGKLKYYNDRLNDLINIELVVTFFIDKSLEYQAMIFSTINRTQKRVSQSLVSSLFGLDTKDTPQKTALQVVLQLNGHINSPFYKRIKLYGGSYNKENNPPLSQATMVKSIVSLISENLRESENDRYRERIELIKRGAGSNKPLPFRKYYSQDKDYMISDVIYFFFTEVKNTFKNKDIYFWDFNGSNKPTNILHTTVGYESLLKILIDILSRETLMEKLDYQKSEILFKEKYLNKIRNLDIKDNNRYSFNQRGKKYFYLDMSLAIWSPKDGLDKRLIELKSLEESK